MALHTNKRTQLDSQGKKLIEKHTRKNRRLIGDTTQPHVSLL